MDTDVANERRLVAAHATLTEAVAKVATSDDWQNLLRISGSFHRYSPNNQLLLAAQGAQGVVAAFHTWKQIPATDGDVCRIRKGETALRVFATVRGKCRELKADTGPTPLWSCSRSPFPTNSVPCQRSATEAMPSELYETQGRSSRSSMKSWQIGCLPLVGIRRVPAISRRRADSQPL